MRNLTMLEPQAKLFAKLGLVAIVADYRSIKKDKVDVGGLLGDARSAVRFVRKHASKLGIDPYRVIGGGASSGGHLMSSAAIITNPAFDDPQDDKSISPAPNIFMGFSPVMSRKEKQWSPAAFVKENSIPVVMCYAKDDTNWIPTAYAYEKAAKAVGAKVDLQLYEKGGHDFFKRRVNETLNKMLPFIYQHGVMDFVLHGDAGGTISLEMLNAALPGYSWQASQGGQVTGEHFKSDGTIGLIQLLGKKPNAKDVKAYIQVGKTLDDHHTGGVAMTGNPKVQKLSGQYRDDPDVTTQQGEGVTLLKGKGQSLTYTLSDLPAGDYVVELHIPFNWNASKRAPVTVTAGKMVKVFQVKFGATRPQWQGLMRVKIGKGETLKVKFEAEVGRKSRVVPVDAIRVLPCYTGQ